MKPLLITCILFFALVGCDNDDETPKGCTQRSLSYDNGKGIELKIDYANWQLTENGIGGGSVNLFMQGNINGDSVTYRTYGDGLIEDFKIDLDNNNRFNISSNISFTATSLPEGEFIQPTLIRVFKNNDTLTVNLESCTLCY